jgi:hypothetical protein
MADKKKKNNATAATGRQRQEGDQCVCSVCGATVIDSDEQRTLHLSMRHVTEVIGSPGKDTGEFFEYRAPA